MLDDLQYPSNYNIFFITPSIIFLDVGEKNTQDFFRGHQQQANMCIVSKALLIWSHLVKSLCSVLSRVCSAVTVECGGLVCLLLCVMSFCFRGDLCFLNCDDICMCFVHRISSLSSLSLFLIPCMLTCRMRFLSCLLLGLCGVCSHLDVLCLSVRLFWYPMWWMR